MVGGKGCVGFEMGGGGSGRGQMKVVLWLRVNLEVVQSFFGVGILQKIWNAAIPLLIWLFPLQILANP